MGLNFYYYDGLQPKMSVGMIKEHECTYNKAATVDYWQARLPHRRPHHWHAAIWQKTRQD